MNIVQTGIPGLVVIKPRVFEDDRGYFSKLFSRRDTAKQELKEHLYKIMNRDR